jgi:hypothetical protein
VTTMTWTISDDRNTVTITLATEPPRAVTFTREDAPAMLMFLQGAIVGWMRGA